MTPPKKEPKAPEGEELLPRPEDIIDKQQARRLAETLRRNRGEEDEESESGSLADAEESLGEEP